MSKVLIVGYGVVGKNLHKEYGKLNCDIYDKKQTQFNTKKRDVQYDFAFICVDTPYVDKDNPCQISDLVSAIKETNADTIIIKSTVLPKLIPQIMSLGRDIIFSPEYYGGTQHCNNFEFDFTVLGGLKQHCVKVIQLLQEVYDGRHRFVMTDHKTACLAKYMENSYLAMKVSFCSQFAEIAESMSVDYEELRELFVLDPRVDPAHTFVYTEHPFWSSHCLNKDVPAIAESHDAKLLKSIISYNDSRKTP